MKQCPQCRQTYSDDIQFCLNDGSAVSYVHENGSFSGGMPTVFMPNVSLQKATPQNDSKWLYLIIGALTLTVVALAVTMLVPLWSNEKGKSASNNQAKIEATLADNKQAAVQNEKSSLPIENQPIIKTPAISNLASPSTLASNITPAGKWSGTWTSKSTYFTAEVSFNENSGKVSGQIVWTIQRTTNPKKIDKIGMTAIEYVQGIFNPATRMLDLKGYRKDDPNNIIILDKYNLSLAENNQTISGKSINGTFTLKR